VALQVYDGDPMHDHSLVSFLDKFIIKKPKVRVCLSFPLHALQCSQGTSV
jgi:hypothetical protein